MNFSKIFEKKIQKIFIEFETERSTYNITVSLALYLLSICVLVELFGCSFLDPVFEQSSSSGIRPPNQIAAKRTGAHFLKIAKKPLIRYRYSLYIVKIIILEQG